MNIDTTVTKEQQLAQGYFQAGTGPEEILLIGSCRTIAFLSYLVYWNETVGKNRFTIRRIDPCDWMEVGIQATLNVKETDPSTLNVIQTCNIFLHEHLINFGMFNTDPKAEKNIYSFGMSPEQDISIPNFNDHMILANDYVDYGGVTPPDYIERGKAEIEKFCSLCTLTSFPEFSDHFRDTWREIRYFWRPNHTSAAFTVYLFRLMNIKFLELDLDNNFWNWANGEDLFRDPHTAVTDRDVEGYKLLWR